MKELFETVDMRHIIDYRKISTISRTILT